MDSSFPNSRRARPSYLLFPPGYRFSPTDEELISYYLNKKINGEYLMYDVFNEINLYEHEPEELVANYSAWGQEKLYVFTPRERKYAKGSRPSRATREGYWKATGSEKPITIGSVPVGAKKALVYYKGKPAKEDGGDKAAKEGGDKTDWIMHEYISPISRCEPDGSNKLDDWVLCCIQKKRNAGNKPRGPMTDAEANQVCRRSVDCRSHVLKNNQGGRPIDMGSNCGNCNGIMARPLAAATVMPHNSFGFSDGLCEGILAQLLAAAQINPLTGSDICGHCSGDAIVQPLAVAPIQPENDFIGMMDICDDYPTEDFQQILSNITTEDLRNYMDFSDLGTGDSVHQPEANNVVQDEALPSGSIPCIGEQPLAENGYPSDLYYYGSCDNYFEPTDAVQGFFAGDESELKSKDDSNRSFNGAGDGASWPSDDSAGGADPNRDSHR